MKAVQAIFLVIVVTLLNPSVFSFITCLRWSKASQVGISKLVLDEARHSKDESGRINVRKTKTLLSALFDDSIDLTPTTDGGILKRSKRRGNPTKGFPQPKDVIDLAWKIYHANGTLAHDSSGLEEPFSFTIGAEPRHVILGWEIAVKTMFEGEIAALTLESNYAFGVKGVPLLFIEPNVTINCEIEILKLRPNVNRVYQSVGFNESIKDELMDKIHSGESVVSSEVMANKKINATKTEDQRQYFDPVKHKLDPNQVVKGTGENHIWEETPRTMDVEIPLPDDRIYTKQDIMVNIATSELSVSLSSGIVLLNGPLGGKVIASDSMWALLEPDYMSQFVGKQRIVVSLEKRFCSQEIWATVLNREFLGETINFDDEEEGEPEPLQ